MVSKKNKNKVWGIGGTGEPPSLCMYRVCAGTKCELLLRFPYALSNYEESAACSGTCIGAGETRGLNIKEGQ